MPALDDYSHISSYEDADGVLNGHSRKTIGNNTKLIKGESGTIYVRLHSTDVVVFNGDGTINLYTGDYRSKTTKDRLNRYTPQGFSVVQRDKEWYVERPDGTLENFREGHIIPEP